MDDITFSYVSVKHIVPKSVFDHPVLGANSESVYIGALLVPLLCCHLGRCPRTRDAARLSRVQPRDLLQPLRPAATAEEAAQSIGRGSKDRPIMVNIYTISIMKEALYSQTMYSPVQGFFHY